jgi:hypothetical protein
VWLHAINELVVEPVRNYWLRQSLGVSQNNTGTVMDCIAIPDKPLSITGLRVECFLQLSDADWVAICGKDVFNISA